MHFVIVTGMSGAGKSTVLDVLEDAGYFCVDNLPLAFVGKFAEFTRQPGEKISKVALGVDIRSGRSLNALEDILEDLSIDIITKSSGSFDDVMLSQNEKLILNFFTSLISNTTT